MNDYLICICDDMPKNVNIITAHIKSLMAIYPILAEPKELKFREVLEQNALQVIRPDLLILDLYDKDTDDWAGKSCLELIKASGMKIPTILYYGDKDGAELYTDFIKEFPFVIAEVDKKKDRAKGLKDVVEDELLNRLLPQFKLRYESDLIIQSQVLAIGTKKLNQICWFVCQKYGLEGPIELDRMVSGYSGAFLFKFRAENTDYILKASPEISKLRLEHENAKKYYHKFPFFNYIDSDVIDVPDKEVVAIIIKLVENSRPLFDFIIEKENFTEVEAVLQEFFLSDYGMKKHYRENRGEKKKWTSIFEKFEGPRFSIIEQVAMELRPLTASSGFNIHSLKNFLVHHSYDHLDANKLFTQQESVLCHGDLHSKNILIQVRRPLLIDTGGIKYDYWCMDICRLIADLFIKGLDYQSIDFYDVHQIAKNVELSKLLFRQKPLSPDGKNDKFISVINWLVAKCEEIYGDLFTKIEFNLGLIKEFLQLSTRAGTVSPNKRAISLLAAYEGMLLTNEALAGNA